MFLQRPFFILSVAVLLALAGSYLFAQTEPAELEKAGQKLVVLAVADRAEPFVAFQCMAMRQALQGLDGMVLDVLDAAGDADLQQQQLKDLVSRKPDYLVLSAVDAADAMESAKDLAAAGTQIIGIDERLSGPSFVALPHIVQKELGAVAARTAIEALKRKAKEEGLIKPQGRILHLIGAEDDFNSSARAEGFYAALAATPEIQVVHEGAADWTDKGGAAATQEALKLQKNFDVVVAQSDYIALGAANFLSAQKKRTDVMVIGMDSLAGHGFGLDLIITGVLDASVHQAKPMQVAFELIRDAQKRGGKIPLHAAQPLKIELITAGNVDDALRRVKNGEL
jgi:inositol transport system substrate-binding protein